MLWIKVFHLFFIISWFAGIFYLPRLFVYHALATDTISTERFKVMEAKLYFRIMTPTAILALIFGAWLIYLYPPYLKMAWLHFKLSLVLLLIIYHIYLGKLLKNFSQDKNKYSHIFYRILNEIPVFLLLGILILVVIKPM